MKVTLQGVCTINDLEQAQRVGNMAIAEQHARCHEELDGVTSITGRMLASVAKRVYKVLSISEALRTIKYRLLCNWYFNILLSVNVYLSNIYIFYISEINFHITCKFKFHI